MVWQQPLDTDEEQFEIFRGDGTRLGLMPRSQVHREGQWHRAVQVLVYRSDNRLLLQQRSAAKDLHPGCWDTSVGEHLLPGEAYLDGAVRGLKEELSITESVSLESMGGTQALALEGEHYKDCELQQAFRCVYDGEVVINRSEVQSYRWVNRTMLEGMLAQQPPLFTPWFYAHLERYELVSSLP